jgi:hypothetical protein
MGLSLAGRKVDGAVGSSWLAIQFNMALEGTDDES